MHDQPSTHELLEAVKGFIDTVATTKLSGHDAFHARVASNVLAIVLRELTLRPNAESNEAIRLLALLGSDGSEDTNHLNQLLSEAIRAGDLTPQTPGLLAHLKTTAIDQLKIDQPTYSGLKAAIEDL